MQPLPAFDQLDPREAEGIGKTLMETFLGQERDELTYPVTGAWENAKRWYQYLSKHATRWAREILHDQSITVDSLPNPDTDDWLTLECNGQVLELVTADTLKARRERDLRPIRQYLIHVRIGHTQPSMTRIAEAATAVKQLVDKISGGNCQLAYTSHDGATFGFFANVKRNPDQIRSALYNGHDQRASALRAEDSLLVLELGKLYTGNGFSRAWTWLQHHPAAQADAKRTPGPDRDRVNT